MLIATTQRTVFPKNPLTGARLKKLLGRLMFDEITEIKFFAAHGETTAIFKGNLKETMEFLESYPNATIAINFLSGIRISLKNSEIAIKETNSSGKEKEIKIEVDSDDIVKSEIMTDVVAGSI